MSDLSCLNHVEQHCVGMHTGRFNESAQISKLAMQTVANMTTSSPASSVIIWKALFPHLATSLMERHPGRCNTIQRPPRLKPAHVGPLAQSSQHSSMSLLFDCQPSDFTVCRFAAYTGSYSVRLCSLWICCPPGNRECVRDPSVASPTPGGK